MSSETGPGPIAWVLDVSVLDRIQMDVVPVSQEILLIANPVLPIAWLPDAAASLLPVLIGHLPVAGTRSQVVMCESPFDLSPPFGKSSLSAGRVQMQCK